MKHSINIEITNAIIDFDVNQREAEAEEMRIYYADDFDYGWMDRHMAEVKAFEIEMDSIR